MERKSPLLDKSAQIGEPLDLNSGTCSEEKHENNDTALRKNSNEMKTKDTAKSCQQAKKVESDVAESDNSGKAQNGEMSTATIIKSKSELDSSGSSSRSSALTKRLKGIKMKQFCKDHEFSSDVEALIYEIADKHDQISRLRDRLRDSEQKIVSLESKIKFRENIIRELRTEKKKSKSHESNSSSPALLTPPRTPELNSNDSCGNSSDVDTMYKSTSNFLTVPGQKHPMSASGDSCFSLYDLDQESKPSSEVNFQLYCYDDANQRDELERLHHMIVEMESENGCNRLLLTKLEDELLSTRRREIRTKHDRDLKADKLKVLQHKIKTVCNQLMDKSNDEIKAPILNLIDLATIEDDLKPEYELFNNLIKSIDSVKKHSKKINDENSELVKTMDKLKIDLSDALDSKRSLEEQLKKQKSDNSAHIDCNMLLGKELPSESIGELSSSPESAESSLSHTNSLTEVINDWRRELEEKNCLLKDRNSLIQSLEEQLKHRNEELSDMRENHQSVELDRDRNCQMVNQLKSAIQIHNESIQYLKRQNAELRSELNDAKHKLEKDQNILSEVEKKNTELYDENQNLHKTINNLRDTIEEIKSNHSVSGKTHRTSIVNRLFRNLHDV